MNKNKKTYIFVIVSILMLFLLGYICKVVFIDKNRNNMGAQEEETIITEPVEEQPIEYPKLDELAGGYIPTEDIIIDNYKIAVFEIIYDIESKEIAEVFFRLRNTLDYKNSSIGDCPGQIVTSEKISLKSQQTPIGVISLEGLFSPKEGKYWGMPPGTVVLKGKIVIENNEAEVYSKDHEFTFTFGE